MAPRIVFVVMSAVAKPGTIDQLARSLAPHRVLVHHDFAQTPDFRLEADNVLFVPNPKRTGWATFGFVEGIFHALEHAVEHLEFDYLQLLSPTCLPIKPMAQFEAHVSGPADAHFGAIDLLADRECLLNVGYRAFTPEDSLRHRVLRRLTSDYFSRAAGRRDEAGIWLRSGSARWHGLPLGLGLRAAALRMLGRHPFGPDLRPYYGSVWFGAKPAVVRGMVDLFKQPKLRGYFQRIRIAEEFLVPTLLMHLSTHKGPLHHFINRFDEAHPGKLVEADLSTLRATRAYFARKFPDDPGAAVRIAVLKELAGSQATTGAPDDEDDRDPGPAPIPPRQEHPRPGASRLPSGFGLEPAARPVPAQAPLTRR